VIEGCNCGGEPCAAEDLVSLSRGRETSDFTYDSDIWYKSE